MFGSYPAYPDIAGALGYSGADFRPGDFDIFIKSDIALVQLMRSSLKADFDQAAAQGILSGESVTVVVDLKDGEASSTA